MAVQAAAAATSDVFAAVAVSAGGAHSAVVCADGSVYTCGRGELGQVDHFACAARAVAVVAVAAALLSFLLLPRLEDRPPLLRAVPAVWRRCPAVRHSPTALTCCHALASSPPAATQLGHGVMASETTPRRVGSLRTQRVRRAALGSSHSLFLTHEGVPYACGCGGYGRLGLGGRESVSVPTLVSSLCGKVDGHRPSACSRPRGALPAAWRTPGRVAHSRRRCAPLAVGSRATSAPRLLFAGHRADLSRRGALKLRQRRRCGLPLRRRLVGSARPQQRQGERTHAV